MTNKSIAGLALAAVLAGCTSLAGGGHVDWQNGAKHGWVAASYSSATPRDQLPRCLAGMSAAELDAHRYVRVDYRHVKRMLVEVAELPGEQPMRLGERVELWPQDCEQGKLSQISRRLPDSI